jgi:hypothetical protein
VEFKNILQSLGESILENKKICDERTFNDYNNLLSFFEYKHISEIIRANTKCQNNIYFCDKGVMNTIFTRYF